jgi:hypothetical protein
MIEVTDWVDFNFNIQTGAPNYITPPYPSSATVSLMFDEDVIPDLEIGSWVQICAVNPNDSNDYNAIMSGNVTNRTSAYRSYGIAGYVLEWQFEITSYISVLQNADYYNNDDGIGSNPMYFIVYPSLRWEQISDNLTWAAYGPATWDEVDLERDANLPEYVFLLDDAFVSYLYPLGAQNVWDAYVTSVYGIYGFITEGNDGTLYFRYSDVGYTNSLTLTQDMIKPDLLGGERIDEQRNSITLDPYSGTAQSYYDNFSIEKYGERSGTLPTYLSDPAEMKVVGDRIIDGMSYPILSTSAVSVDLINPAFTNAERLELLIDPLGKRITVQAPLAMGGTQDYLIMGVDWDINRNTFSANLKLAPYSQVFNSLNWLQVPYNYTWTSYGVAFPTQEWQDL